MIFNQIDDEKNCTAEDWLQKWESQQWKKSKQKKVTPKLLSHDVIVHKLESARFTQHRKTCDDVIRLIHEIKAHIQVSFHVYRDGCRYRFTTRKLESLYHHPLRFVRRTNEWIDTLNRNCEHFGKENNLRLDEIAACLNKIEKYDCV
jgi:hypothetical protein